MKISAKDLGKTEVSSKDYEERLVKTLDCLEDVYNPLLDKKEFDKIYKEIWKDISAKDLKPARFDNRPPRFPCRKSPQ